MNSLKWWQSAVFYQIYPRSFADGNGDGIGDLKGILSRLDYLQWLGVDAIWLSPHFPSPQVDWGYDISDYRGVAPEYGSLAEMHTLIAELHKRGMRLVLDLVLNHTSDQHPWFIESRSGKDNPKRDWYIWKPERNGGPPNNWYSTFGGSAWEWDEVSGEYYYHFFFKEQPDLNWRNPQVKEAMFSAVKFWLDAGIDGFRLDAIGTIFEGPDYRDQTCMLSLDELYVEGRLVSTPQERARNLENWEKMFRFQHDRPEVHDLMKDLRRFIDGYPERVLIGETDEILFYGNGDDELDLVFNFPLMRTRQIDAAWVRKNQAERLGALPEGAWPCNTLGNHDSPRMLNRFGDGSHDGQIARANLAMLLTLKGTPFLYNGEEIGMVDYLDFIAEQFRDPLANRAYRLETHLLSSSPQDALKYAAEVGRDKCRTPLQWANQPNGGFCPQEVTPWLPVHPNYREGVNVGDQEADESSLLHYYRRLMAVRKASAALKSGEYQPFFDEDPFVLAFLRKSEPQTCLVMINLGAEPRVVAWDGSYRTQETLFTSRVTNPEPVEGEVRLEPFEVRIELVEPADSD